MIPKSIIGVIRLDVSSKHSITDVALPKASQLNILRKEFYNYATTAPTIGEFWVCLSNNATSIHLNVRKHRLCKYRMDQKFFHIWIGSCTEQLRWGGAGGLRNARVANGNLVTWHQLARDNLSCEYASTVSIMKKFGLITTYCTQMKLHRFNWLKNGCRTSRKLVQQ